MSGRLRTYDGAVDGVDVLRGLVVTKATAVQSSSESEAAQPPQVRDLPAQSLLERVLERATDVIGTREEALRWLGTPVRALNYATPISLLTDESAAGQVFAVLTNLENGIL